MKDVSILKALHKAALREKKITIIKSKQKEEQITCRQLWERSHALCIKLQQEGIPKRTEILICCSTIDSFMYSFWACIMGEYIPVPIDVQKSKQSREVANHILEKLDHPFLLYDSGEGDLKTLPPQAKMNLSALRLAHTPAMSAKDFGDLAAAAVELPSDAILYIQFSSGSTGVSKGIEVRSSNLAAHIFSVIDYYQMNQEDSSLSWSPLSFCYGLTNFHLLPIILGIDQYLIPTGLFMQDPLIWMDKVHEHRVSRLGAVPFALKHFINFYQKSDRPCSWDLSCVKTMSIGGEQISGEACSEFTKLLSGHKLAKDIIMPAYGLAEATTYITTSHQHDTLNSYKILNHDLEIGEEVDCRLANPEDGATYLEVGSPLKSARLRILDAAGKILPEKYLGLISVKGDMVTNGYYQDPLSTEKVFSRDGWLSTGDIGFLINEKLVVVGRGKEIVVSRGKKYSCIMMEAVINRSIDHTLFGQAVVGNGMNHETGREGIISFVTTALDMRINENADCFIHMAREVKQVVYDATELIIDEIIPIDAIPKTYSGKTRRLELMNRFNQGEFKQIIETLRHRMKHQKQRSRQDTAAQAAPERLTRKDICAVVVEKLKTMFHINVTDYNLNFQDYGIVSTNIPPFLAALREEFQIDINVSAIFNYSVINQFVDYIYMRKNAGLTAKAAAGESGAAAAEKADGIAIIGMSCRFPGGGNDPEAFWQILTTGKDCIVEIPETRWHWKDFYHEDVAVPGKMYCKKSGFLDVEMNEFDARFFNISPKEAMATDPQQRMLLELTWEAFENACLDITDYNGSDTGVYLGISSNEYSLSHLYSGDLSQIDAYSLTGTGFSTACGRISYTFGFEGPCFAVDTACSSSLTGLHAACSAIQAGESKLAVVAGINLILSPANSVGFTKLQATAKDGHSKAFDADADGYGRGEGGGVLLLKRLSEAERDHDNILGVIVGSGLNQDGKSNGLTAPNGAAQVKLIQKTLAKAGLDSQDIDYMEMHGTGTKLGDPIEINAAAETYAKNRTRENPLRIGSVKTNIGHLEPASGIASIIKVLLSMKHQCIPANLNFKTPNPFIDWDSIPIEVVSKPFPWVKGQGKRRAAVSGFGFGGSNAHVIIEDYKQTYSPAEEKGAGLHAILKISAKTEKSLRDYVMRYIKRLEACEESEFSDIIYSANRGRADFEYRLAVTGAEKNEMVGKLKAYLSGNGQENICCNTGRKSLLEKNKKVVFMFTGQGSQYVNMGKTLFAANTVFRDAMNLCDHLFKPYILKSMTELLYGEAADAEMIAKTVYAQPLIFSIEYALLKMWEDFGVIPEIVMGHSIGEYAAAVAAKMITLEDAVKLVSIRGRLMDAAPGAGAMGTVFADELSVQGLIRESGTAVSIAACNARESCVISGERKAVESVLELAEKQGIRIQKLTVSHAFHSYLMEPVLADFKLIAEEVAYNPPQIRFYSSLYTREIESREVLGAAYWTAHIREKVDFYHTILKIDQAEDVSYLEVGSNRVLSALCKLILPEDSVIAATLSRKNEEAGQVAEAIAALYTAGISIHWKQIQCFGRKTWNKVSVPGYPYDKNVYAKELLYENRGGSRQTENETDELLGQSFESPLLNNTIVFQRKFRADEPYFMGEHIIFNAPISPAAAHISMLLSAVKAVKNPASCTLRDIELRVPLVVNEGEERLVQISLEEIRADRMKFQIVSRDEQAKASGWVVHALGEVTTSAEYFDAGKGIDVAAFEAKEEDPQKPEEGVYAAMRKSGFYLGKGFRRIVKSSCQDGESFCLIEAVSDIPRLAMYEIYPGIIDSILQSQLCALLDDLKARYENDVTGQIKVTMIPYYMGAVSYNFRKAENIWVHGRSKVDQEAVYTNLEAYNTKGEAVFKMRDIIANMTDRDGLFRDTKNGFHSLYYHPDWITAKLNEEDLLTEIDSYGIIANEKGMAELIGNKLEAERQTIVAKLILAELSREEYAERLIREILPEPEKHKLKLLYCCGMERTEESGSVPVDDLKGLLYLVKAIDKTGRTGKVKIKIITKNVHPVDGGPPVNLSQSLLWGLAKVIGIEYPDIFDGIVDTDEVSLMSPLLIKEILCHSMEEVCLCNGKRYVGRLVQHGRIRKVSRQEPPIRIMKQAAYLITGGTGALGLAFARYLAGQGAKRILMMCRTNPDREIHVKLDALRETGIKIELVLADVCDKESVTKAINEVSLGAVPIRGVIHAAGLLSDKLIIDQDWVNFAKVLDPKVQGTLNIYQALPKGELDFFIMTSSIASLIGNLGQSNYVTANYFMNRFAEQLQREGIKAYAMCWGSWQSGGMASGNTAIDKTLVNMGIKSFSPETGSEMIAQFFAQPFKDTMIADINWERFGRNSKAGWQKLFLSELLATDTPEDTKMTETDSIMDQLDSLDREDRKEFLLDSLTDKFSKIMGFHEGESLSAASGLREQGADSLMIFSMRAAVNKLLNINIDVSTFFNYPSLLELSDYLIDEILYAEDRSQEQTEASTEDVLDELEKLIG